MENQLEQAVRLQTTRQVVDGILSRHKGNNFAQCQKCGSVNSDAWELLKTLDDIKHEGLLSEEEFNQEIYESCDVLLGQIMEFGFPENCWDESYTLTEWLKENERKYLNKPSDEFGFEAIIKFYSVILKTNNKCRCFINQIEKIDQISNVPKKGRVLKEKINKALSASIYNKLQTATAALALLKVGKKIPKDFIERALKDLKKIEKIID